MGSASAFILSIATIMRPLRLRCDCAVCLGKAGQTGSWCVRLVTPVSRFGIWH